MDEHKPVKRNPSGIALAGGGPLGGIYEVGALVALDEALCGLRLNDCDVFVGVSSGAPCADRVAEGYVAQVHDALKNSPQWDRMVFVLNFDESGGFFDHVNPSTVRDDTKPPAGLTQTFPTVTQLGFRVPCIVMGPFAPKKIESTGPYEHCSILKMIEWRWGLQPMTVRDAKAKNFAEALDFSKRRDPITLPAFVPNVAEVCANPNHLP